MFTRNIPILLQALVKTFFYLFCCRRDSRKLPIGDPDIDWEETIYLNLIIHLFEYKITLAICTRTSPSNLQVIELFKHSSYAQIFRVFYLKCLFVPIHTAEPSELKFVIVTTPHQLGSIS